MMEHTHLFFFLVDCVCSFPRSVSDQAGEIQPGAFLTQSSTSRPIPAPNSYYQPFTSDWSTNDRKAMAFDWPYKSPCGCDGFIVFHFFNAFSSLLFVQESVFSVCWSRGWSRPAAKLHSCWVAPENTRLTVQRLFSTTLWYWLLKTRLLMWT